MHTQEPSQRNIDLKPSYSLLLLDIACHDAKKKELKYFNIISCVVVQILWLLHATVIDLRVDTISQLILIIN